MHVNVLGNPNALARDISASVSGAFVDEMLRVRTVETNHDSLLILVY